jgi:hypothetical protein
MQDTTLPEEFRRPSEGAVVEAKLFANSATQDSEYAELWRFNWRANALLAAEAAYNESIVGRETEKETIFELTKVCKGSLINRLHGSFCQWRSGQPNRLHSRSRTCRLDAVYSAGRISLAQHCRAERPSIFVDGRVDGGVRSRTGNLRIFSKKIAVLSPLDLVRNRLRAFWVSGIASCDRISEQIPGTYKFSIIQVRDIGAIVRRIRNRRWSCWMKTLK